MNDIIPQAKYILK